MGINLGDNLESGLCLALYVQEAIAAITRELKRNDAEWQESDQVKKHGARRDRRRR